VINLWDDGNNDDLDKLLPATLHDCSGRDGKEVNEKDIQKVYRNGSLYEQDAQDNDGNPLINVTELGHYDDSLIARKMFLADAAANDENTDMIPSLMESSGDGDSGSSSPLTVSGLYCDDLTTSITEESCKKGLGGAIPAWRLSCSCLGSLAPRLAPHGRGKVRWERTLPLNVLYFYATGQSIKFLVVLWRFRMGFLSLSIDPESLLPTLHSNDRMMMMAISLLMSWTGLHLEICSAPWKLRRENFYIGSQVRIFEGTICAACVVSSYIQAPSVTPTKSADFRYLWGAQSSWRCYLKSK